MQHYLLTQNEWEEGMAEKLEDGLIGPPLLIKSKAREELNKERIRPPSWWHGDEDASQASEVALRQMKRG